MGCSPRIQQIVGKGKRGAAEYIKTSRSPEILYEILDRILSHEISINDSESIDWIRWLMAGGNTPENFTAIVKKYHNASICGLVWTAQCVAYRCRTCSLSPCMSLCAECFRNGKHDGHDYNMFRSQTGGACDCGDSSVMQCSGFCSKHGTSNDSKKLLPPPDLLYIAELMAPRIFCRLILHLRNYHCRPVVNNSELHVAADEFLGLLCELSDMGAAMMRVLTSALTNTEVYRKLTQDWSRDDSAHATFMATSENLYRKALNLLKNPEPPTEFKNCPGLQINLIHKTFLEELVFWTVKYEFPQKLINFLLVMLPDPKYKEALTEAFVLHYSRIAMVLEQGADPDTLSKRISKISVQWFSNKELAVKMTENLSLLQVMVVSLKNMIERILVSVDAASSTSSKPKYLVVDCKSSVVSQCRYWLFVSDLNSVLSYEPVAMKFMNDEFLVKTWFILLSYFQGMNINQRKYNKHVEYEQDTDSVFLAELWTTSPISPLLSHLKDQTTVPLTKRVLSICLEALETWLQSAMPNEMVEDQVSFHIPLHRSLATFISHAVNVQKVDLSQVMPPDNLIRWILSHPLRIQAAFHEIINGLWARNGLQIRRQAMTYTQNDFCSSMVDADLFLLQILASRLPSNEFMLATIEQFKTKKWFRLEKQTDENTAQESASGEDATVEGFLQFWATLCANRTNLGNSPSQNIRMELVTLLCLADRTHSQLSELLPERCGNGKSPEFDVILAEVADYKPPNFKYGGNMQQGLYTPKARVWDELYDPIHVLLRTGMNRKDLQNSTDRFLDHLRKNRRLPSAGVPWSPYRIPTTCEAFTDPRSILNGRVFHALVWVVLYKYVHQNNVPENVLSLTIYLLELAASVAAVEDNNNTDQEAVESIDVTESNLEEWFTSDRLANNVRTVVQNIGRTSCSSSQTNSGVVEVFESIVSLLLKCHSKLGGQDITIAENGNPSALANRIGNGVAIVEKTLCRIALLGEMCRKTIKNCHEKLHAKSTSPKSDCSRKEHTEKKRKAEERRRRIMESLAKQRDKFAKENVDEMDWQDSEASSESEADRASNEKYYCGICRKMLSSTKENPIMLLTQVQATSVLGHRQSPTGKPFAEQQRDEVAVLNKEFSDWSDSVTLGWEDGVYVQSCSHVFDHRCLIPIQKNEYSCPVCRQSSNSVIPILPSDYATRPAEKKPINDLRQAMKAISKYLEQTNNKAGNNCELFEKVVNTSLESMRNCLNVPRLTRYSMSEKSSCSMLFLVSVMRCNLEMELMLRGGSLVSHSQEDGCLVTKKSCILPLLRMMGTRARKLNRKASLKIWRQLISSSTTTCCKSSDKRNRRCIVPILLRDPIVVLLHLTLMLSPDIQQIYFVWIVKILYMLVNFQAAVRLSYHLTEEERNYLSSVNYETSSNPKTWCYDAVMRTTVRMLETVLGGETSSQRTRSEGTNSFPEFCLPFLRVASILRSHLYGDQLPLVQNADGEQEALMAYLKLEEEVPPTELEFVKSWFVEFVTFAMSSGRSSTVARTLLSGNVGVAWCLPKLITLPYEYKDVFQNYQQKSCIVCQQMNEKISMCLVCGTLVCLQGKCCERSGVYEAVRHADDCGAGTSIYLTISSSNVVIIRGPKACIWGSMYLDAYGEEDPDLKRGRPLYLSSDRYHLLEHEWLSHNFNRVDDAWILHKYQL